MISVDSAIKIIQSHISSIGYEYVALEKAPGRVLAQDIVSDIDQPPFHRSKMDGYALKSQDTASTPCVLQVIGEVAAGETFPGVVGPGQCVKIMTGAPLPEGADAVQKIECTVREGDSVRINTGATTDQFITMQGSELARGQIAMKAGIAIGPAEVAVLASFGYSRVAVARRPKVAVVSTGDELIDVDRMPSGALIRDANRYSLWSAIEDAGGLVTWTGRVSDEIEETLKALNCAIEGRHLVVVSGGVSAGDYDVVRDSLREAGAEILFDRVAIRPGKPVVFARRGDVIIFGLPGNPVSALVTFNLFVKPVIRMMQGDRNPFHPIIHARTRLPVKDSSNRRSYLPASVSLDADSLIVELVSWTGSSDVTGFVNANGLLIVPEDVHEIAEGAEVRVVLLDQIRTSHS